MSTVLTAVEVLSVIACLALTGAAVLAPQHGWLQLLASVACTAFGWFFGLPPGAVLSKLLSRMRPSDLAAVVNAAARSMPPERAAVVLQSLTPPPSSPPVPVVFDAESGLEPPEHSG